MEPPFVSPLVLKSTVGGIMKMTSIMSEKLLMKRTFHYAIEPVTIKRSESYIRFIPLSYGDRAFIVNDLETFRKLIPGWNVFVVSEANEKSLERMKLDFRDLSDQEILFIPDPSPHVSASIDHTLKRAAKFFLPHYDLYGAQEALAAALEEEVNVPFVYPPRGPFTCTVRDALRGCGLLSEDLLQEAETKHPALLDTLLD
jgi:hypothetical protein